MQLQKKLILGSMIALGLALLPLPYAYYMLLRIGICGVFAFLAYTSWQSKQEGLAWILGITAAIYNPFVPLHLGRELWSLINIATIGLLFYLRTNLLKQAASVDSE